MDKDRMVAFQYAAAHGDRSQAAAMIRLLQTPLTADYTITLLHSLSLLGATQALPAFDSVIKNADDPEVVTYAKVARARLIAESTSPSVGNDAAQAAAKVRRFYQEMGLTVGAINAAIAAYESKLAEQASKPYVADASVPPPLEAEAVLQLADMVYQSKSSKAYAALPEIVGINFTALPAAAIKMRLAPLSRRQRVAALTQELATEKPNDPTERYKIQLLADEGAAGRQAVAGQMQTLQRRAALSQAMGFAQPGNSALQRVMEISGGGGPNPPAASRLRTADSAVVTLPRRPIVLAY